MKKITIKKFLSTILAVCMIAPVFSSCSGQENEKIPEGVEVVLKVSPFNGGYGLGWLNDLKKAYEKKNPKVYISYAANVVDRNAQTTEIYGGIYKNDIYFTGFGYHSALNMYKGQIRPLDDVYEKIGDDVITSSVIDWLTYEDGHLYSLPWATAIGGILYHEDYFKANNISIPNTTNELLELCNQITTLRGTKKTGYPFGYSYEDNYWEYLFGNEWTVILESR
jgi:ABC-type glycerol-3-phosphate transport system substrate-binding protein